MPGKDVPNFAWDGSKWAQAAYVNDNWLWVDSDVYRQWKAESDGK